MGLVEEIALGSRPRRGYKYNKGELRNKSRLSIRVGFALKVLNPAHGSGRIPSGPFYIKFF
jgi:hypothetical protein